VTCLSGHNTAESGDVQLTTEALNSEVIRATLLRGLDVRIEFLITHEADGGVRLEAFSPDEPAEVLSGVVATALGTTLRRCPWKYVLAFYPKSWHRSLGPFGFRRLSERLRMELMLEGQNDRMATLSSVYSIEPLSSSAECLGEVLRRSEQQVITRDQCVRFCRSILANTFGPVIPSASCQISLGDRIVGACIFTEYLTLPLLGHIFIDQAFQRHGLATVLLRHCLQGLHAAGYRKANLMTDASNDPAKQLYEKAGFTVVKPPLVCAALVISEWVESHEGISDHF
jgi:ribosomal protein S18 acetylase RimI-like enzyme